MTAAAPTSSTARALIAACLAEPDEDGPRLAFADWLDENPLPEIRCNHCSDGWVTSRIRNYQDDEYSISHSRCLKCSGKRFVADDFHARWAELIRVQCEVAGHSVCDWKSKHKSAGYVDCEQWNDLLGEGRVMTWCQECLRRKELVAREKQLLPTLRARLMPRCPGYHGDGHGWEDCPLCGKHPNPAYGICPGDIMRGFPVLAVPLSECGREELKQCELCNKSLLTAVEMALRQSLPNVPVGTTGRRQCDMCKMVWQPAPWLAAARARGATVEVSDRKPRQWDVDEWYWDVRDIPGSLFKAVGRGKIQTSPADAVAALGRAVMGVVQDAGIT